MGWIMLIQHKYANWVKHTSINSTINHFVCWEYTLNLYNHSCNSVWTESTRRRISRDSYYYLPILWYPLLDAFFGPSWFAFPVFSVCYSILLYKVDPVGFHKLFYISLLVDGACSSYSSCSFCDLACCCLSLIVW